MNRSYKSGLIALAILVCVILVVLLLNLESNKSGDHDKCFKLDGGDICHLKKTEPYRYYGTKTVYDVATKNRTMEELDVSGCEPKLFYLLSRHSTRYPDEEQIIQMMQILPVLKEKIYNASLTNNVKLCKSSIQNITDWVGSLTPEQGDEVSTTGEADTMAIAKRLKVRFPSLLNKSYSPEDFEFGYTSRKRTKSTAEAFAKGFFEDIKNVDLNNKENDGVLQFNKECSKLRKNCTNSFYDTTEVSKFENGSLIKAVIKSVSDRIGFPITYDELKVIYRACVFGYAVGIGDTWCNVFSTDELKVIEFGDDLDDYYSDAYGNQINIDQACPAVKFVNDLFQSYANNSKSRAVLHFSHAGAIKKVFAAFSLFKDSEPLKADKACNSQERKWRSSFIAPFTANLAFVLYDCNGVLKVGTFHNENPVQVGGCDVKLCPYKDFLRTYSPEAVDCNIRRICCDCC